MSPLAEGRELKSLPLLHVSRHAVSPLAEGRELKYAGGIMHIVNNKRRPSRRGVN